MQSLRKVRFLPLAFFLVLGFFARSSSAVEASSQLLVFFGTYTGCKSQGIYVSRFDMSEGTLTAPQLAVGTRNPSFLALHPKAPWLYAVGEVGDFGQTKSGTVSAFHIDKV